MKKLKEQIEEILGVYYVGPHSPSNLEEWKGTRLCGDCFCTRKELHTHNEQDAAMISLILQAVRQRDRFVIGEYDQEYHFRGMPRPLGQVSSVKARAMNDVRASQRKRAEETL